jgi:Flp pilus assembly protein TadD
MGRAASEVLAGELAGTGTRAVISYSTIHAANAALGARPLITPGISTERPAGLLAGANRILYGRVSQIDGKLRLDASVFDVSSQKVERTLEAEMPKSDGIIRLADALAKEIGMPVRPYDTQNGAALQDYCAALEASDPAAASQAFSRTVDADPNFGEAYVAWIPVAARQNNKTEVERILALASARGNTIGELNRARLEAIGAELRGDAVASARALETISRLNPTDSGVLRQLAEVNLKSRRYADAAENFKKALVLDPNDAALLNQLGYVEMYAGNLSAATKALDGYARLRPDDPNALDSLGDVNFSLGQFATAEKYYRQSFDKDNNFNNGAELMKAAHARLMTGDIGGADAIFNPYLDARRKAGDRAVEFRRAEWEFLSGRRREAIARMDAFARNLAADPHSGMASEAYTQLAVWELELGDRARARDFALRASQSAASPLAIARFLTEPPARLDDWSVRAQQMLPGAAQERSRKAALAYALLLQKELQAAEPVLADLYQHTAPDPKEILPALLAWARLETGHFEEAERLVNRNPVPNPTPEIFASLAFPRLLFLRAVSLDKSGRREEAAMNYRLFLKLSGPDAKAFGEEATARHAIEK